MLVKVAQSDEVKLVTAVVGVVRPGPGSRWSRPSRRTWWSRASRGSATRRSQIPAP